MMRLADVLRYAPDIPADVTDLDFVLRCSCGTEQRLNVMTVGDYGPVTLYDCAACENSLVGVMADDPRNEILAPVPMSRRQEPGGHRVGGHIVGSKVDIAMRPPDADRDLVLIPATPNFFVQYLNM
ncbi:hypothetical protein BH20ACT17_BH20ACT17_03520 [soil metagenome]